MKRVIPFLILMCAVLSACTDRIQFSAPSFVSVKSESGSENSTVLSTANNLVLQYPVNLVSAERSQVLEVAFEVVPGNGLQQGVDYSLPESRKLIFSKGEYQKYIRINFLKHVVDAGKDNTLTIKIVSVSDQSVTIGYPGPSKRFSAHTITKVND